MDRVLQNTKSEIRVTLISEGVAVAPSTGTVTVTITRDSDGTAVVTGAAAPAAAPAETGVYAYSLTPANLAELDILKAVWSATINGAVQSFTTYVEVVGGWLTSLKAITDSLPSGTTATTARLVEARNFAETFLEDECGVAFRPRYRKETLDGSGNTELLLSSPRPQRLLTSTVNGTAISDLSTITLSPTGTLYNLGYWSDARARNVAVAYVHGHQAPPEPISRAATKLARHYLVANPSDYDERATSITTDEAAYSMVTAGVRGQMTSIPEVNTAIAQYRYVRGIA